YRQAVSYIHYRIVADIGYFQLIILRLYRAGDSKLQPFYFYLISLFYMAEQDRRLTIRTIIFQVEPSASVAPEYEISIPVKHIYIITDNACRKRRLRVYLHSTEAILFKKIKMLVHRIKRPFY